MKSPFVVIAATAVVTAALTLGAVAAAGQFSATDQPEPHRCEWVIV